MDESAQHSSAESKVDAPAKKSPSDFLKQVLGKPVIVQLNSGVTYRGILACLDGFLNIAMEQTEEYVDGQLKNRYGDCFIRGNNGKMQISHNSYSSAFEQVSR
jgi:U6 snRNA-associated Sm-like protein LSm6